MIAEFNYCERVFSCYVYAMNVYKENPKKTIPR